MRGILKGGAVALAILGVTGCRSGVGVVGVSTRPDRDWPDTGAWDTSDPGETGVDTEEPTGPWGGLALAYTFDPGLLGVTSCAEADLDTLSVILTPSGGDARAPIVFPCLGQELRVYEVAIGLYTAQVVGGTAPGVTWESEPAQVYVTEDALEDVPVLLGCRSNDVDDGCGGA